MTPLTLILTCLPESCSQRSIMTISKKIDVHKYGSPIQRGRWRYARSCRDYEGRMVPHELEIAIEVNKRDCEWLYDNCFYDVNDHSWANTMWRNRFRSDTCHKYNHFGKPCPFPLNIKEAILTAHNWYPDLFNPSNCLEIY